MTDDVKKEEQPQEQPQAGPQWEKREFNLNSKMKDVIKLSVKATEAEITALRRKLKKLQYGA